MHVVGAKILNVTELAERRLIEISLPGIWQIEGFKEGTKPIDVSQIVKSRNKPTDPIYSRFDQGLRDRKIIPASYRAAISDVEHILEEFYDDLEPFEKFLFQIDRDDRAEIEERMIEYAEGRFFPALSEAMKGFESAAASAERDGIREEFRQLAQKRLFPLILCSPFFFRVITQPIGVPGDFGILGKVLGHPYEGHSLYSRMLNAWAITADPSKAYRHRIELLGDAINEIVCDSKRNGSKPRILSMASGVAYEVQRFVKSPTLKQPVDFELVDFSQRTLIEAKRLFRDCKRISNPKGVDVILKQGSVVELAMDTKRAPRKSERNKYDLVYCAGLFDYLSERLCSKIVSYLYGLTKPGGKLIVSNYTPENASRYFMELVLEWELIYRHSR